MPDPIIYIGYCLMVALVVVLSMKIGKYVDIIDAKSNISGAFIGGVMLAAVTSLPELFTSLSAIWLVGENSMVIGNILGSDLTNLAFLGIMLLLFGRGLREAKFSSFYYTATVVSLVMYGLVTLGMYFGGYLSIGWYTAVSPVILILYVVFIKNMPKTEESDDEQSDEVLTLKQAVVRFAVCAVVLIAASILMTYLTDKVAGKLNIGKTFAGALFLGVATSLPELISSSTLCIRGNYNAAAGNIIGSNIFNFMILVVADLFSFMPGSSGVYMLNGDSQLLLILGVISSVATLAMFYVKNRGETTGVMIGTRALNVSSVALYILYLLMTTGVIAVL